MDPYSLLRWQVEGNAQSIVLQSFARGLSYICISFCLCISIRIETSICISDNFIWICNLITTFITTQYLIFAFILILFFVFDSSFCLYLKLCFNHLFSWSHICTLFGLIFLFNSNYLPVAAYLEPFKLRPSDSFRGIVSSEGGRRDPVGRSDEEQCNSIKIHAMRNTVAKMRETMMLSSKKNNKRNTF